ncbi:MAG: hypothetical protein HC868_17935, partial [Sphingomonadales bacterium]|nr:hypothetical protein [Sphingomonadales bacterium]
MDAIEQGRFDYLGLTRNSNSVVETGLLRSGLPGSPDLPGVPAPGSDNVFPIDDPEEPP